MGKISDRISFSRETFVHLADKIADVCHAKGIHSQQVISLFFLMQSFSSMERTCRKKHAVLIIRLDIPTVSQTFSKHWKRTYDRDFEEMLTTCK